MVTVDSIEARIKAIKARIRDSDPSALEDARKLAEGHPDEPKVWQALAYAYDSNSDYAAAIAAITREMAIRPGRPDLCFIRGGYKLMLADYNSAIEDFSQGIARCDELNDQRYREVLHFLRAEAFVQLGRKAEARADLEHVEDDCTFWTIQVRTKAELVALAAE